MTAKEMPVSVMDEEKGEDGSERIQPGSEEGAEPTFPDASPRKIHGFSVCSYPSNPLGVIRSLLTCCV